LAAKRGGIEMGGRTSRRGITSIVSILLVFSLLLGAFPLFVAGDNTRQEDEVILRIGAQDEPKTRNILASGDVWTANVLGPVYDSVTQMDPETEELKPYILKGTDVNGNGMFDDNEYGVFTSMQGKPLEVTAFYDFNGVIFHDGYQATVEDLLFSYHMNALDPRTISLDVLKDRNNLPGTNYSITGWLHLNQLKGFVPTSGWLIDKDYSDPSYDTSLRAAVHFKQQAPYANFFRATMSWSALPRHLWEDTGCIYQKELGTFKCDIHKNNDGSAMDPFGIAYDPATGNGLPESDSRKFDFGLAESWDIPDEYVIGTGAFTFDKWVPGQFAKLNRFEDFYTGESYIHKPYITGMLFKVFKTTQTAVFALRSGDIDYIAWSIPPAFVPELLNDANIGITSTAEKGFFYLSYNMRTETFGYPSGNPANGDAGKDFRQAVAHLIDKKTIVTSLLQNYGIVADGPVSPTLARWYNSSLPQFPYDEVKADDLLDGYDPWDSSSDGPCTNANPSGCRSFPVIGNSEIEILTPNADYDPIRAAAGTLIAQAMNEAGINARSVPTAFGEIVTRIDARDFQMFILGWRIGSDPPDYFHAFFYSLNAGQGQNYPGYKNSEFDQLILDARKELDPQKQVDLIWEAQGVLAYDRPYDVLYFRTNIEAYRSDKFTNWTVGAAGTIFSYWSWLGIHQPPPDPLRITTSIQTAVKTDKTAKFIATVRDPKGDVLSGAEVEAYVSSLEGDFIQGSIEHNYVTGTTDLNGQFKVTYRPPTLVKNDTRRTVFIYATAKHVDYPDSRNATITIVVHPPGGQFLSMLVNQLGGDLVEEGRPTLMSVKITDQDENPVFGSSVVISSEPPMQITPSSGTTDTNGFVNGVENIEIIAPKVANDQDHLITITATLADHETTERNFTMTVADERGGDTGVLDLTMILIIVGVVVAVVVVAFVAMNMMGGKRKRRRKIKKLKEE
jgi:ABC-type transport system substrate-binding protein